MATHYYGTVIRRVDVKPDQGEALAQAVAKHLLETYGINVDRPHLYAKMAEEMLREARQHPSSRLPGHTAWATAKHNLERIMTEAADAAHFVAPTSVHPAHPSVHYQGTSQAVRPRRGYVIPKI
ncbi:hypothetical protein LMBV_044 [Largemouth bass virus]|uniref:Uncharacterized protein n=1 Tax=Largemouth bass virus TaxID=176656 RepID=A0A9X7TVP7_9VIRU|nr:hypothetical protein OA88_22760 [Flavobacterium sp. JRM]QJE49107.1 hypothetical protein LMBV_044 [Largemouth bass virus]QJE49193.1 hypothetical protein LMBV_044 [Largemouth bass virus]